MATSKHIIDGKRYWGQRVTLSSVIAAELPDDVREALNDSMRQNITENAAKMSGHKRIKDVLWRGGVVHEGVREVMSNTKRLVIAVDVLYW